MTEARDEWRKKHGEQIADLLRTTGAGAHDADRLAIAILDAIEEMTVTVHFGGTGRLTEAELDSLAAAHERRSR